MGRIIGLQKNHDKVWAKRACYVIRETANYDIILQYAIDFDFSISLLTLSNRLQTISQKIAYLALEARYGMH